jgi:hypothetical protein
LPSFRLDRLSSSFSIVTKDGRPSQSFQFRDTKVLEKIEAAFDALDARLTDIETINAQLAAQLAQIIAAQAAADAAQSDATDAAREAARINSYPNPGVGIVTASDAGTDATVTIANHTRVYPVQGSIDVPDVAITGGSITGLAYTTTYFIYYDDTTLADTTPTFHATTVSADAQVGAAAGRHFVGYVTTPASGGGSTSGGGGAPPGGGGGGSGGAIP